MPDRGQNGVGASELASPHEVVIVGGGIAGIEALLALRELAGDRASLTLLTPEPELTYRPLLVSEPFSGEPAPRYELAGIVAELGVRLVQGSLAAVEPERRLVHLDAGEALPYDATVICVGAQARAPFRGAATFDGGAGGPLSIDRLLARAAAHPSQRIAFVVPPGVSWPLPIYELALMAARRARERGEELEIVIVTPEAGPLIMFGPIPSRRVHELLRARGISFLPSAYAGEDGDGIVIAPGGHGLDAGGIVALPVLDGPDIEGLPADRAGFIPIDEHARVRGAPGVYAAGDGTSFPIKQGGLATQQADAAAEAIAAELGAVAEPKPFRPVLRGKLIAGEESLQLRAEPAGGGGEGIASDDSLWWPPHKVAGLYLAPWLNGLTPGGGLEPPRQPIEVEIALPRKWHRDPIALDPYASLSRD